MNVIQRELDRELFEKLAATAHTDEHLRQLDTLAERASRNAGQRLPLYGDVIDLRLTEILDRLEHQWRDK